MVRKRIGKPDYFICDTSIASLYYIINDNDIDNDNLNDNEVTPTTYIVNLARSAKYDNTDADQFTTSPIRSHDSLGARTVRSPISMSRFPLKLT